MKTIIELSLRIIAPIVELIFRLIGKAEAKRKNYKDAIGLFQNIDQTTISEEKEALGKLNENN